MNRGRRFIGVCALVAMASGSGVAKVGLSIGYEQLPLKEFYAVRTERYDGFGAGYVAVATGTFSTQADREVRLGAVGIRGAVSGEFLTPSLSLGLETGLLLPLENPARDWTVPAISTAAGTTTTGEWQDSGIETYFMSKSYRQTGREELKAFGVPALVKVGYRVGLGGLRVGIGLHGGGYLVQVSRKSTRTLTYVEDSAGWQGGQVDEDVTIWSGVVGVPAYGGNVALGLGSGKGVFGISGDVTMLGKERPVAVTESTSLVRTAAGQVTALPVKLNRGPEVGGLAWGVRGFVKF